MILLNSRFIFLISSFTLSLLTESYEKNTSLITPGDMVSDYTPSITSAPKTKTPCTKQPHHKTPIPPRGSHKNATTHVKTNKPYHRTPVPIPAEVTKTPVPVTNTPVSVVPVPVTSVPIPVTSSPVPIPITPTPLLLSTPEFNSVPIPSEKPIVSEKTSTPCPSYPVPTETPKIEMAVVSCDNPLSPPSTIQPSTPNTPCPLCTNHLSTNTSQTVDKIEESIEMIPSAAEITDNSCIYTTIQDGQTLEDIFNNFCGVDTLTYCSSNTANVPTFYNIDNVKCPSLTKTGDEIRVCCNKFSVIKESDNNTITNNTNDSNPDHLQCEDDLMIPVSVEYTGTFCSYGPVCVDTNSTGLCPTAQEGLPEGSYCGLVGPEQNVYGCKRPLNTTSGETMNLTAVDTRYGRCQSSNYGKYPISIEGLPDIFCSMGPALCTGLNSNGSCPGAQPGLEYGSHCTIISETTGVYGCKENSHNNNNNNNVSNAISMCKNTGYGTIPVSVVGVDDIFCIEEPNANEFICAGENSGICPIKQNGLIEDSMCILLPNEVYGCVLPSSYLDTTTTEAPRRRRLRLNHKM